MPASAASLVFWSRSPAPSCVPTCAPCRGACKGLYCLQPWNEVASIPQNAAFLERFHAKFHGPLEHGWLDYHAAQAYTSLLVAGQALAESERTDTAVTAVLRRIEVPSPLGDVRFINFIDYYQQNPGSAVVAKFGPAEPEVVYPLDRVLKLAEEDQPNAPGPAARLSPLRLLLDNQVIALFVVLSLGLLVGQFKVKGVALGMAGIYRAVVGPASSKQLAPGGFPLCRPLPAELMDVRNW